MMGKIISSASYGDFLKSYFQQFDFLIREHGCVFYAYSLTVLWYESNLLRKAVEHQST